LFRALSSGVLQVEIGQEFPLREAAAAHAALESRRTTGSTILIP
jgi:NADPH2:quinone reductase